MGGNLDRIQITKGRVGADGRAQERVYDVTVSDGRTIDASGGPELITVWTDPEFDPAKRVFHWYTPGR